MPNPPGPGDVENPFPHLPDKDLFTLKEVAAYFGNNKRTVQRWIKKKLIIVLTVNGRSYVPRHEILRMLRGRAN